MGVGSWELGDEETGKLGDWETIYLLPLTSYLLPFTSYLLPSTLSHLPSPISPNRHSNRSQETTQA